jgi:hypothetical protein
MNSAERYALLHYKYFRETVGYVNLANVFEIPSANIALLKITNYRYGLLWEYDDLPQMPLLRLPDEVCAVIRGFVGRKFSALFEFELPPEYPFMPPKWAFDPKVNHLSPALTLGFEQAIFEHNCQNNEGWSPALKFEKDILNLSVRVSALI